MTRWTDDDLVLDHPRRTLMTDGLHHKYDVTRRDGRPIVGCFVLEYTDPAAPAALAAYAAAIAGTNPTLASELTDLARLLNGGESPTVIDAAWIRARFVEWCGDHPEAGTPEADRELAVAARFRNRLVKEALR